MFAVFVLALLPLLGMQPCAEEDSSGPCYWNAGVFGNGIGHSFVVLGDDTVLYLN